jgi:hypothetical protein
VPLPEVFENERLIPKRRAGYDTITQTVAPVLEIGGSLDETEPPARSDHLVHSFQAALERVVLAAGDRR